MNSTRSEITGTVTTYGSQGMIHNSSYLQQLVLFAACPLWATVGIGWRRGSHGCRVPKDISMHPNSTAMRQGKRGISKKTSKLIMQLTGKFIPVGS
ncbi:hypothetical protein QZH41_010198, partial [Actinostola sp. cb2023]